MDIWLIIHSKNHLSIIHGKIKATHSEYSFCASGFLSYEIFLTYFLNIELN